MEYFDIASIKYAKDFSRVNFWHYTKEDTLQMIVNNKSFLLNNLSNFNDLNEAKRNKRDKYRIFVFCFCNSNNEKIPMWYLYSGIDGKGASIGLTPLVLLNFINTIDKIYVYKDNYRKKILKKYIDFTVESDWIYYIYNEKNCCKYNSHRVLLKNYNNIKPYFIKEYPWEYEKEFRIVIKTKEEYKNEKLCIDIPENIFKKIKIKFAPEIEECEKNKLYTKYSQFDCSFSKLNISMNLCKDN